MIKLYQYFAKCSSAARTVVALLMTLCVATTMLGVNVKARNFKIPKSYKKWEAMSTEALMKAGHDYSYSGEHLDSAMVCYMVVAGRLTDGMNREGKHQAALALNNMGYHYTQTFIDYQKAYSCLQQCLEICDEINDDEARCLALQNLGNLYSIYDQQMQGSGMLAKAIGLYRQAMYLGEKTASWNTVVRAFINICSITGEENSEQAIKDDINWFLSQPIPAETPMLDYAKTNAQGRLLTLKGDYQGALKVFEQLESKLKDDMQMGMYLCITYSYLAQCYYLMGDMANDLVYVHKMYDTAKDYGLLDLQVASLRFLYETYADTGDKTKAEKYRIEYLEMKDSLNTSRALEGIRDQHFIYEIKSVEEQKRELAQKSRQRALMIVIVAIVALAIAIVSLLLWHKNRQLKQRNAALYRRTQEMLEVTKEQKGKRYQHSNLKDDDKPMLLDKIYEVFDTSQEIFNPDFNLDQMAHLVGSNSNYVSQVINELAEKKFATLLGDARVREACRRFNDDKFFGRLTIEGVAMSVGFRSRTSMVSAFKRVTGLTPSEYIKASKM